MADSISDIKGVHIDAGCFSGGVDLDLFDGEASKRRRASVIFGRNGSGKTTIANFIDNEAGLPEGPTCFYGYDHAQISLEGKNSVRVFSERYVREKILIDDDGLEAIVMLGDQAVASKRISEIDSELVALGEKAVEYVSAKEEAVNGPASLAKLEKAAKDRAKNGAWKERLTQVEGGNPILTATRWGAILNARNSAARKELEVEFETLLEQYKQVESASEIIALQLPGVPLDAFNETNLRLLLSEELDRPELSDREKRLLELARAGRQDLIESARAEFSKNGIDHCPMCQQEVSPSYKASLVESISKILSKRAEEFKARLESAALGKLSACDCLPEQVSPDVADAYRAAVDGANAAIDKCNELLSRRKANLYVSIEVSDLDLVSSVVMLNDAIDAVNADITRLNEAISDREQLKRKLLDLNNRITYNDARDAIAKFNEAKKRLEAAEENLRKIEVEQRRLNEERGAQESKLKMTEIAVKSINRFLAAVYFDAERFKLVPAGDVYKVESYGKPVAPKDVSTGERNILALCYFFSEGGRGKFEGCEDSDPQYLVIDDPVSSFDMENRVGICSMLRERVAHVLDECGESRVTLLTHDVATVAELEHVLSDIRLGPQHDEKVSYCLLELSNGNICKHPLRKSQYSVLLKKVYDYAVTDVDDYAEACVIGNVMRRVLEAYGTFNYGVGMDRLSRDEDLKVRFGDLEGLLANAMYRLALNDDSHMQEKVFSLNSTFSFERYSYKERRMLARCALLILYLLDAEHVKKQLCIAGASINKVEENLRKWEKEYSERWRLTVPPIQ
ncbi:AAA family ATPase [Paratractidigestivibacter sp.]|uniref:AAA family ATPase n=1 Tax=Paratractidigestivibacter sp. TaxID=2847316 RepID=UPI002AC9BD92|nr:AAA family ATPase [Paratractidigestivibacter sp.]